MSYIAFVIDGPPGENPGRFVELENDKGASIGLGEWVQNCPYWELRVPDPRAEYERGLRAALEAVRAKHQDIPRQNEYGTGLEHGLDSAEAAIERLLEQTKGEGDE